MKEVLLNFNIKNLRIFDTFLGIFYVYFLLFVVEARLQKTAKIKLSGGILLTRICTKS